MNKEIAMEWVEALRSGKYAQGKSNLRKNDNYCCLGVLCEILNIKSHKMYADYDVYHHYGLSSTGLDSTAKELSGIRTSEGEVEERIEINNKSFRSLAAANDGGISFEKIATWIEANYEQL